MNRREFLKSTLHASAAAAAGPWILGCGRKESRQSPPAGRKLIIVQFGGGTRNSETIDDPKRRWAPRLMGELVRRGTLFTNLRVEGKVVHPNSTGSMVTGHWEWDDIDWTVPTVFEHYRKHRGAGDLSCWAFCYASILVNTSLSTSKGFGLPFAANAVEPPTIPRSAATKMDRLMRDAAGRGRDAQLAATEQCAKLAKSASRINTTHLRSDAARAFVKEQYAAWKTDPERSTSHDAFLTDMVIGAMRRFAPDVMSVCYGEIDCAHYGSWSRYVEAIARTDALTHRLWSEVQRNDAYRGKTLMLILPDHGRELDRDDGPGWMHHSDFYTNTGADEGCRRVWMLALDPGVAGGRKIDTPVPLTAAAATGLEYLNLEPPRGAEPSVLGRIR